jgi:hypothetical protein
MERRWVGFMILIGGIFFSSSGALGQPVEDEMALFKELDPDALIVLDLSGSMNWTPAGQVMYTLDGGSCDSTTNPFYGESGPGTSKACTIDAYGTVPKYSNADCTGPFYRTDANPGYRTDCSRLAIAKRALFDVLDDNDSGTINKDDETSLGIRLGYMRFYDCSANDSGGDYSSGCNRLINALGTKYSKIYCNSNSSCSATGTYTAGIAAATASGGTPLAAALHEAKLYLDAHKATDNAAACRHKFVLLITDGMDTFSCSGNGNEGQEDQYKRRRETVAKAKALADAGYRVFVLGFGAEMPHFARNTLNWMAYHGGTDNPLVANSGNPAAYDPSSYGSCQVSPTDQHNIENDGNHFYATEGDPGEIPLSGYAYLATNSAEFSAALKQALNIIREATYSFSVSSVASSRTHDENNIYEASFDPLNNDPFWRGHLKKYAINADGSIGEVLWDAGSVLRDMAAGDRNLFTHKGGSAFTAFTPANITKEDLAVANDTERDKVIGYIRGEAAYNPDNWKLGDIFRSNPITIASPSPFFEDIRDRNNAFAQFRAGHPRTSALGNRVVAVGANDGQLHAFRTSDGREVWSFIPPNFLSKLKNIAHTQHPTTASHQYFVDGPVMVSDVWLGDSDGTAKSSTEWKTLLIFGEGRGASSALWSSSPACDSGFSSLYAASRPYYCGYYAFDVTDPLNPLYQWRLSSPTPSLHGPYLGEPWSRIVMGRVKINGNERWVGFFGGGYNGADCAGGGECDTRGKGFFVVDLRTGEILWSYTRADDSNMNYSLPSSPAVVDTDNDGFIDTAYIGDLGGSVWRFKFCSALDDASCNTANWAGGYLYAASTGEIRPIFSMPAVAKDLYGQLWVYWGTGDRTEPMAANAQEKFYAVKDTTRSQTYRINNLENITTGIYSGSPAKNGWYINLAGSGEKVLAEAAVFGGVVYFTSYTPANGNDPCSQAGTAKLWGVNYMTGAALLSLSPAMAPLGGGAQSGPGGVTLYRNVSIGSGIPTAPILSFKPGGGLPPDLYVTVSGGAGINVNTSRVNIDPPTLANRCNVLYWRDRRL